MTQKLWALLLRATQGASVVAALVTEIPPLVYVPCPAYMYSASTEKIKS